MIFFFSGTGNTRWAAEQLAAATGERLIAIAEAAPGTCTYELQPGERVGFCFPVHGWQPPRIVRQFIRRLKLQRAGGARPYCYALVTCGDSIGRTMEMLDEELRTVAKCAQRDIGWKILIRRVICYQKREIIIDLSYVCDTTSYGMRKCFGADKQSFCCGHSRSGSKGS